MTTRRISVRQILYVDIWVYKKDPYYCAVHNKETFFLYFINYENFLLLVSFTPVREEGFDGQHTRLPEIQTHLTCHRPEIKSVCVRPVV